MVNKSEVESMFKIAKTIGDACVEVTQLTKGIDNSESFGLTSHDGSVR